MTSGWRSTVFILIATCMAESGKPTQTRTLSEHRIVARIAATLVTPKAATRMNELLGSADVALAATWADEIRSSRPGTERWHFVSIPVDASEYVPARDCTETDHGDCLVAALTRVYRELTLRPDLVGPADRQEALKWVIHLVVDLHQPLHCTDNDDARGRDPARAGTAGASPALRDLWESDVLARRGLSEEAYVALLSADIAAHPVPDEPMNIPGWAMESHALAVREVYRHDRLGAGEPQPAVILDSAYVDNVQVVVERQLEVAGVRLARILNRLFGGV